MAKRTKNEEATLCPLKHLSNTFGGKWKLPIVCILSSGEGPKRYSVIKRRLGDVTNVMLSQSLRELETAGIIHRQQYNEVPPRVEYSLTERGRSALPFLTQAANWAMEDMRASSVEVFCGQCASMT